MASYQVVNQLIKNLSKAEKKQFQITARKENRVDCWYWIYCHVLKNPADYEKLKKDYEKLFPSGSLSSSMNHLYNNLLEVLIQLSNEDDTENKVLMIIQEVKILFSKGIYEECFNQIKKAKSLCRKHELHALLYVLYRQELMLRMSTRYHHFNEIDLLALQTDITRILNYLQTQSRHQLQYDLLKRRRSGIHQESGLALNQKLDDLALHEQLIFTNQQYNTAEAEKLHLMFQSEYFLAKGNFDVSLRIFSNLHELFEQNKHLLGDPPLHFISHIGGILQNLYQMNALEQMEVYLSSLDEMDDQKPGFLNMAGCISLHYKILQNLRSGKQSEALKLAIKAELLLQQPFHPYSRESSILLTVSAASAFFITKQFSRSGKLLRKLDSQDFSLSLLPVFYTAKIISILTHFEKTDYDVMEAEIRSFLRWVKKYQKHDEIEKKLMKWMTLFPGLNRGQKKLHLESILVLIEDVSPDETIVQSLQLFNWPKWLSENIH